MSPKSDLRLGSWSEKLLPQRRSSGEAVSDTEREPTRWGNGFTSDTLDKGLTSKMYEELVQHQEDKQPS